MPAELVRDKVDGKMATIAYMDTFDGKLVTEDIARVAIVRFDEGGTLYLELPDRPSAPRGSKE
jgi:hypothetical protein